jgi:hypothetical protein
MKFILFILNFRNSNLKEFDLTKILKKAKGYCSFGPAMGFIHEFNIICLFLIYVTFYCETILILQGYERLKIMGIFMDHSYVMGVTYPKSSPSTCRNKVLKFKACKAKKYSTY